MDTAGMCKIDGVESVFIQFFIVFPFNFTGCKPPFLSKNVQNHSNLG